MGNKVLVTGGAGFIGSFMVKKLLDDGFEVDVLDNLSRGHQEYIDQRANFTKGDLLDKSFISSFLQDKDYQAIFHFAGVIAAGESMQNPGLYFDTNINGSLNILEAIKDTPQKKFIFSSTAAVYGDPIKVPLDETHPKNPTNAYGQSKLAVEEILKWYQKIYGISYVALRYFNACGAALDGSMGESHDPETHIIPNAILAALNNSEFHLFGDDYDTPDGTCIRDYIHVLDLVDAHLLALQKLDAREGGYTYNVGTGTGYSNKQVLEAVKKVSRLDLNISQKPRREGDSSQLVADASKIKTDLGFKPQYSDIEKIVETSLLWHKSHK